MIPYIWQSLWKGTFCNFHNFHSIANRFPWLMVLQYCKLWQRETLANLANHLWFTKLKPSKLVLVINNLLADLLIRQSFFRQMLEKSQFNKISPCQTFPPYGNNTRISILPQTFPINKVFQCKHESSFSLKFCRIRIYGIECLCACKFTQ